MKIKIPEVCLVVLIGPSGSGKSSFARKHFLPTEVISSDYCRALISDDENNQDVTAEAFELLHAIAGKRLANQKLTVIDATSVKPEDRLHRRCCASSWPWSRRARRCACRATTKRSCCESSRAAMCG